MATRRMVCLEDFEVHVNKNLAKYVRDYYMGGADGEVTSADNKQAYSRWRLLPRVLRDVSNRDTSTTILGHRISFPVCVSPTAKNGNAHPEGEKAAARAAASMGIGYTLSTDGTYKMEDIAGAAPDGLRFYQLYLKVHNDRENTTKLIQRAEECGYKALVITVDSPVYGKRLEERRNRLQVVGVAAQSKKTKTGSNVNQLNDNKAQPSSTDQPSVTWSDIDWLKSVTSLPIVLKGILTAADAELAAEKGVAGVLVSNHGGRQLDTVPATIDVLPSIVSAVRGRCEIYMDGGIRRGTDVLKAMALGARAVFIGRPVIYGLAYNGEDGARDVLTILKDEFDTTMALTGVSRVADITRDLVMHERRLFSAL